MSLKMGCHAQCFSTSFRPASSRSAGGESRTLRRDAVVSPNSPAREPGWPRHSSHRCSGTRPLHAAHEDASLKDRDVWFPPGRAPLKPFFDCLSTSNLRGRTSRCVRGARLLSDIKGESSGGFRSPGRATNGRPRGARLLAAHHGLEAHRALRRVHVARGVARHQRLERRQRLLRVAAHVALDRRLARGEAIRGRRLLLGHAARRLALELDDFRRGPRGACGACEDIGGRLRRLHYSQGAARGGCARSVRSCARARTGAAATGPTRAGAASSASTLTLCVPFPGPLFYVLLVSAVQRAQVSLGAAPRRGLRAGVLWTRFLFLKRPAIARTSLCRARSRLEAAVRYAEGRSARRWTRAQKTASYRPAVTASFARR